MIWRIQLEEKKLRGTRAKQSLWFLNREKFFRREAQFCYTAHTTSVPHVELI